MTGILIIICLTVLPLMLAEIIGSYSFYCWWNKIKKIFFSDE